MGFIGSIWELWDETNISPENGWLEDDSLPFGAKGLCSGASAVSFRASTKTVYINIQYILDIYIYIYICVYIYICIYMYIYISIYTNIYQKN